MSEYRIRPKSNYLHTASLSELYILSEHWKSDLDYYRDELNFLEELISMYYLWMKNEPFAEDLNNIVLGIKDMDILCAQLRERTSQNMEHIELLKENPFSHDEQRLRDDHLQLEEDITAFIKNFRIIKQSVFSETKQVLNHHRLQQLLNP